MLGCRWWDVRMGEHANLYPCARVSRLERQGVGTTWQQMSGVPCASAVQRSTQYSILDWIWGEGAGEGDSPSSSKLPCSGVEEVGLLPNYFRMGRLLFSLRGELKRIFTTGFALRRQRNPWFIGLASLRQQLIQLSFGCFVSRTVESQKHLATVKTLPWGC